MMRGWAMATAGAFKDLISPDVIRGSGLAGTPLRDVAANDMKAMIGQSPAVRLLALGTLLFIAGCAPVLVVPSLQSFDFWLLILSYFLLACVASAIVFGVRSALGLHRRNPVAAEGRGRWMLAAILMTGITLSHFQVFKQLVLPQRGFPFDTMIVALEQRALGGLDAWEVTHALFGSLWPTLVLDTAYAVWLPIMFLFPAAVVATIHNREIRGRLLGTWVVSWIVIGSLAAWLLGSAGPCYYGALVGHHPGFDRMQAALEAINAQASAYGLSVRALYFQDMLFQSQGGSLVFASGISAMPSMHVAMATLFAIAGFQRSRTLGWSFSAYAALIWIASIHLGWHYASDGLLGGVMMVGLWLLSRPVAHLVLRGARRRLMADTATA